MPDVSIEQSKGAESDVVIGAVFGYTFEALAPFVHSLRASGFAGRTVFLTSGLTSETISDLERTETTIQPIQYRGAGAMNSWSRFWPRLAPIARRMPGLITNTVLRSITGFQTARFFHYLRYLEAERRNIRNVLLTDVRDVVFQGSPFPDGQIQGIRVFEEAPDTRIGDESLHNAPWIKRLFGESVLEQMSDFPVICSGTIMGGVDSMIDFLRVFVRQIAKADNLDLVGEDQGVHNYLCRMRANDIGPMEVVPNGTGEVFTFSRCTDIDAHLSSDGEFNVDGRQIPVLHQYDRIPHLEAALLKNIGES